MNMDRNKSIDANLLAGSSYEDEISIVDLVLILWRNRWAGIVAAAVVLVLTLLYLVLSKPVYESTVYFFPPLSQDVEALNIAQQHGLLGYSSEHVYGEFIRYLNSLELRWGFFKKNKLMEYYSDGNDKAYESTVFNKNFNEKLVVKEPQKNSSSIYQMLVFQFDDGDRVAALLNQFVDVVMLTTRDKLVENIKRNIGAEIQRLEIELTSKRNIIQQRRQDTIAGLEEALLVARKLKINKPADYSREYEKFSPNESVAVNIADKPLYIRGILALEAEIEILKNRKSDDPYISGLRDIQERLDTLRGITINLDAIKIVTIDQPALVPEKPVKPKKLLVLIVGVFMAGFIGLMVVFLMEFIRSFREQLKIKEAE